MAKILANDQNFDLEVLQTAGKPVLVDFWAAWCVPCRTQGPIVEEIATEIGDKAKVVKVEIDESPMIQQRYNILSIPTLSIFKDGKLMWQGVGVHQKAVLLAEINKLV